MTMAYTEQSNEHSLFQTFPDTLFEININNLKTSKNLLSWLTKYHCDLELGIFDCVFDGIKDGVLENVAECVQAPEISPKTRLVSSVSRKCDKVCVDIDIVDLFPN